MPVKNNRPVAFQEKLDLAPFMAPGESFLAPCN